MKTPFSIVCGLAALTLCFAQDSKSPEEAEIKSLQQKMEDGWNKGSGTDFAAPFSERADYVVVNGMKLQGRTAIDKGHQGIFDSIYKGSHNDGEVESVRFVRPDVAIVHVKWQLKFKTPGGDQEGNARSTLVVAKNNGKWEIESFQNTGIAPVGR